MLFNGSNILPVERLEEDFSKETGRPTKELYSMAGLLFLKEYFNWSLEETRFNYMADMKIQYALNIEKDGMRMIVTTGSIVRSGKDMSGTMDGFLRKHRR